MTNRINDIKSLQSEINRLEEELSQRKQNMKLHASLLKESLKPGNLLASGIKNMIRNFRGDQKPFTGNPAKTGLLLLAGKWLLNPAKRISKAFSGLFGKRVKTKKEKRYYKFDDETDSESN